MIAQDDLPDDERDPNNQRPYLDNHQEEDERGGACGKGDACYH